MENIAPALTFDTLLQDGDLLVIAPRGIEGEAREDFLSVPEIAHELRRSRETVRGWIESGELPALNQRKTGKPRWLVPKVHYTEFLERQIRAAQPTAPAPPAPPSSRRRTRTDDAVKVFLT